MVSYRAGVVVFLVLLLVGTVSADVQIIYLTEDSSDWVLGHLQALEFNALRNAAGNYEIDGSSSISGLYLASLATVPLYSPLRRIGYGFNTSTINDTAIITEVKFNVWVASKSNLLGSDDIGITDFNPSVVYNFTPSDYNNFINTEYVTRINYSSVSTTGYTTFIGNPEFIGAINKTGYTNFLMRFASDIDNSNATVPHPGSSLANYYKVSDYTQNISRQPFLEVTYTLPDTTPPGAIQGLTNDTTICEQITWDFQGPGDADWNHTMVYRDGVFQYNLSNITYSDVWSGLTFGTEYTFSSHTVDITGNVDPDWVNMTATPTTCELVPVANFTANETAVCIGDTIQFNDTSTNTPTGWAWDFGDGNVSEIQNATHAYGFADIFTVILSATNEAGSDAETKVDYITVTDCTGNPDFSANVTCQIGAPLPVLFTGFCPDPTYKNHWDFGDGNNTDDVQSPEYTYLFPGTFTVSHSCKYGGQATVFENKTDYIIVGVNGTYCTSTTSGTGVSGDVYEDEPGFPVLFILCGAFGSLLLFGIIGRSL